MENSITVASEGRRLPYMVGQLNPGDVLRVPHTICTAKYIHSLAFLEGRNRGCKFYARTMPTLGVTDIIRG